MIMNLSKSQLFTNISDFIDQRHALRFLKPASHSITEFLKNLYENRHIT